MSKEVDIRRRIDNLLDKYDINDCRREFFYNSYYATTFIERAVPWHLKDGSERYDRLLRLIEYAIDLKCPMAPCTIGKEDTDDTFRQICLDGIQNHLELELGKWEHSNYKNLLDFSEEHIFHNLGWDREGCQALFSLEDYVEERLKQERLCYNNVSLQYFQVIVNDGYQFIIDHPELCKEQPGLDSLRARAIEIDSQLLKSINPLFNIPMLNKKETTRIKHDVRKIWAIILGQGSISRMLEEYYSAIVPDQDVSITGYKIYNDERAASFLPYPIDSPEYQYVKAVHEAYGEGFSDYWLTDEERSIYGIKNPTYDEYPLWGAKKEPRDARYLVAQYLYYCLTMELLPNQESVRMIQTGAIIYDLLCVLDYRKDITETIDYRDRTVQKEKYDLVKRFLEIDEKTGIYKRLI